MTSDGLNRSAGPDAGPLGAEDPAASVNPKLLELLVCPLTKTRLEYDAARHELISRAAGLAFPIRNGVPLMIEDAARCLDDQGR
jgi:uncharacterized protein